ncbi:MAG: branched-chain amino acid transport system substrate-binding protein [Actinomycetota bacterium]|jgi:branched-chain amino acid transport system substrate-binding protein
MRRVAVVLLAAVMLAACGTRLPDSAFETTAQRGKTLQRGDAPVDEFGDDNTATTLAGETPQADNEPTITGDGRTPARGPQADAPNTASDVGVTATTLTIGNITAENGVLGDAFAPAVRGLRAWVAYTNAHGGVRGRQIVLKTCDDREDRNRDLACAQQLVEKDKVFALVSTNSRSFGGSAEYLNAHGVPTIGFPITNSFGRYPHLFSAYRNGYPRDGQHAGVNGYLALSTGPYRWFKQTLGVTEAAVFMYDIDESKQAGQQFQKAMELEGMHVTPYVVSFAAPSFDQPVNDMQKHGTQLIVDAMDDGANRKLCDAMARRNFSVKAKVSTPVSEGERVGEDYNDTCRNSVYVVNSSRVYTATDVPEVAKFRQAYARYQPGLPLHQWAMESWALATMFAEGVTSMGGAPTRAGLEKWLNGLVKYKANGMLLGLDWGKFDPTAPRIEDCFAVAHWQDSKGGWVEATDHVPFCYPDAHQFLSKALEQGN